MMPNKVSNHNNEVTKLISELNHPFNQEIELLRTCILTADINLIENIKWNGPNYCYQNEDRITMRIQPPKKQVQLIFHRGAKKQANPKNKLISHTSKLLLWKENDRAIITFNSMQDIENGRIELADIITEWMSATNKP
jgi:hypothetical protein